MHGVRGLEVVSSLQVQSLLRRWRVRESTPWSTRRGAAAAGAAVAQRRGACPSPRHVLPVQQDRALGPSLPRPETRYSATVSDSDGRRRTPPSIARWV